MTTPLDAITWPVHTRRLRLRPAAAADAESVWRYRRLEEVARWLTSAPGTFEDFRQHFEDPARLAKTLLVERDGVVAGDLMIAVEDAWAQSDVADQAAGVQAELGWCLAPEHQGHGYASEAVSALMQICFETLGLRRVVANCFADNVASWRLMERLGMRRELYAVRESLHRSGEWLDAMGYALLAEEWRGGSATRGHQADGQASIASASTS
jgi:RimJ/RimL family protein N-acetyltransferase